MWNRFGYGASYSLISAAWPNDDETNASDVFAAREEVEWVINLISEIRSVRSEMNVPPSQKSPVLLQDAVPETLKWAETWFEAISRMARASEIGPLTGPVPKNVAQAVLGEATIILPLEGLIDLAAEKKRLAAALAKAQGELAKVQAKLANADFTARAPEEVLEEHRERAEKFGSETARLELALARLA